VAQAEQVAYGPLNLKPSEFERLTPREFELMCKGYEARMLDLDVRLGYFFTMATNVHLKASQRITVKDVMKALHPPTEIDRIRDEAAFKREWEEALSKGGEDDGTNGN
jgi:hypothetical protein